MTDALTIAQTYIATWNETDATRRAALIGRDWAPTANYIDPLMAADGPEALNGIIAAVQERFPGFVFSLLGKPDGFGDNVRFSWGLGIPDDEIIIEGTDFVRVENGLITGVTGFLDKVPAAA
ncbi:MAG: Isomerase [Devosia sp.]|uniref:nuclear transport factor 2 family protein n=1 Tax=Devosia sp. TaxID=1871048 RepID=UPI00262DF7E6|nr:nuclear transport factor 2 family protein [Devosia sp.]MDB5530114.1 Isomerase [Devosia sp.]